MANDIFMYVQYEPSVLGNAYGGGVIVPDPGTFITTPLDFSQRRMWREVNRPAYGTRYIGRTGVDGAGTTWLRITQGVYNDIVGCLTTFELSTATATMPTGFVPNSRQPVFFPIPERINLIGFGDSITEGVGAETPVTGSWLSYILPMLDSSNITLENSARVRYGDSWATINLAEGSSSWNNTLIGGGNPSTYATYPKNFSLAFNQRFRTLPLTGTNTKIWINCFLGTNDLFYAKDASVALTAETIWEREVNEITKIRNEFPNAYLTTCTSIRREESQSWNNILRAKNNLQKTHFASVGINKVIDIELEAHPDFNTQTGNTTASSFSYTGAQGIGTPDNTHPNDFGYIQIANLMRTKALEIKDQMNW